MIWVLYNGKHNLNLKIGEMRIKKNIYILNTDYTKIK